MFTSFYASKKIRPEHAAIRTSLGAPRFKLTYHIEGAVRELMPERPWLGMEYDDYLKLYVDKLQRVGVDRIEDAIRAVTPPGRIPVLLCFEHLTDGTWCHRRMFAEWWWVQTGQKVPEL